MAFPNTTSLATFTPESQLICLNEITTHGFVQAYQRGRLYPIKDELSVIYHELTHWADTVGTIWGNDYLKTVYLAYDAMRNTTTPGAEKNFSRFLAVYDAGRRLTYDDYYRELAAVQPEHSFDRPWRIAFSNGLEFDLSGRTDEKRPICFVRFGDHDSGRMLVRQPLCLGSLLETTAMWSEMSTLLMAISEQDAHEQVIDTYVLRKKYSNELYAPEFTLYSAPVHMLAHYTGIRDAALAYQTAAMLSLVCLNLVGSHFNRLRAHAQFSAWGSRIGALKRGCSRPFAFMNICMNGSLWRDGMRPMTWIDAALTTSGLPSYREILDHAVRVLSNDSQVCEQKKMSDRQRYMRQLGARWLASRRDAGDAAVNPSHLRDPHLAVPVMFDAECNLFSVFSGAFDTRIFDPTEMFDAEGALRTQIIKFRKACR